MTARRRAARGLTAAVAASLAASAAAADGPSPRTLYLLRCSGCHGAEGVGSRQAGVPAFPGFISAFAHDDEGRTYMTHVPGVVGSGLDDGGTASVLNYVLEQWAGADAEPPAPFTAEEVAARRAETISDVVSFRRQIATRLAAEGVAVAEYPWP